jgi:hypothetical protein
MSRITTHVRRPRPNGMEWSLGSRTLHYCVPQRFYMPYRQVGLALQEIDGKKSKRLPAHGNGGDPASVNLVTHSFGRTTFGVAPYSGYSSSFASAGKPACADRPAFPECAVRVYRRAVPPRSATRRRRGRTWGERNTTQKPMLLFPLSGGFLLRYAQRALSRLLFHEPPRTTSQTT